MDKEDGILVSVVVAMYNAEMHISECIRSLLRQDFPKERYEVIVVDDGSTDSSPGVIRRFPEVTYIRQENSGPSAARNRGINISRGDFVAFVDSDCICPLDWLRRMLGSIEEDITVAGVGSSQVSAGDETPYGKKVQAFLEITGFAGGYMKSGKGVRETDHNPSCNVIYRKLPLIEAGGFRDGLFPGEDVDLDRRLRKTGYRILFFPDAPVQHYRPPNTLSWYRMLFRYGRSSGDNVRIHGFFRVHHYMPWIVLAGALTLVVISINSLRLSVAAIITVFLLIALLMTAISRHNIIRNTLFMFETLVLFSSGYFWGLLRHGLNGNRSITLSSKLKGLRP